MMKCKKSYTGALLASIALYSTNANAELHKASISAGYYDQTTEFNLLGISVDADSDGIFFSGNIFINDNISLGATIADGEVDDSIDIDTESTSFGVAYHFSRTDLRLGEGFGTMVGLLKQDSEVSVAGVGSVDTDTDNLVLGMSYGMGNGFTLNAGYNTDLDEPGDIYDFGFGIMKAFGNTIISADYFVGEVDDGGPLTAEVDGFQIRAGYLF